MDPISNLPQPTGGLEQAELSPTLSLSSQTLTQDARTLSIILSGLSAQAEGSGPRGSAAAGTLTVPVTNVTSTVFVKVAIRGEVAVASASAIGRVYTEINGFAVGSGFSDPGTVLQQELNLQLSPAAPVIVLNLLVSCQVFGPDANASALVNLDSVDITLQ